MKKKEKNFGLIFAVSCGKWWRISFSDKWQIRAKKGGSVWCQVIKKGALFFSLSLVRGKVIIGAFNLHLLEFTFVYQFYSRKTNLVESTFWNPVGLFAFMSFHNHFKLFWYCVLLKMRVIFCPYLFWNTAKLYLNW